MFKGKEVLKIAKRTLENCSLIRKFICTLGKPNQYDGKCEGYAGKDEDEPITKCKECKLNTTYEDKILKGIIMKINKPKYVEYMKSDKGFKILREDEEGNIKSFKNLDNGKTYRI